MANINIATIKVINKITKVPTLVIKKALAECKGEEMTKGMTYGHALDILAKEVTDYAAWSWYYSGDGQDAMEVARKEAQAHKEEVENHAWAWYYSGYGLKTMEQAREDAKAYRVQKAMEEARARAEARQARKEERARRAEVALKALMKEMKRIKEGCEALRQKCLNVWASAHNLHYMCRKVAASSCDFKFDLQLFARPTAAYIEAKRKQLGLDVELPVFSLKEARKEAINHIIAEMLKDEIIISPRTVREIVLELVKDEDDFKAIMKHGIMWNDSRCRSSEYQYTTDMQKMFWEVDERFPEYTVKSVLMAQGDEGLDMLRLLKLCADMDVYPEEIGRTLETFQKYTMSGHWKLYAYKIAVIHMTTRSAYARLRKAHISELIELLNFAADISKSNNAELSAEDVIRCANVVSSIMSCYKSVSEAVRCLISRFEDHLYCGGVTRYNTNINTYELTSLGKYYIDLVHANSGYRVPDALQVEVAENIASIKDEKPFEWAVKSVSKKIELLYKQFDFDAKMTAFAWFTLGFKMASKLDYDTIYVVKRSSNHPEELRNMPNVVDWLSAHKGMSIDNITTVVANAHWLEPVISRSVNIKEIKRLITESLAKSDKAKAEEEYNFKFDELEFMLPQTSVEAAGRKAYMLEAGDIRMFTIGYDTCCCQHMEGAGETAMMYGLLAPYGGFWVVEDEKTSTIKAQAEMWEGTLNGKRVLVFDNIEYANDGDISRIVDPLKKWLAASPYDNIIMGVGYNATNTDNLKSVSGRLIQPKVNKLKDVDVYTDTDAGCVYLKKGGRVLLK